jgi:hypothetical protein
MLPYSEIRHGQKGSLIESKLAYTISIGSTGECLKVHMSVLLMHTRIT